MHAPLREPVGLRKSMSGAGGERAVGRDAMAGTAFWLAAAATAVGILALLLPHGPRLDEAGLAAVTAGAAALAVGTLVLAGRQPLPEWVFHAGTFAAAALATAAIYFSGEGSLYGPLPYVWVALYAFVFFDLRWALVQMAAIGALFALELILRDPPFTPVGAWVVTLCTLASAGLLVSLARGWPSARAADPIDAPRRDRLTGLLNRHGFEEVLDMEVERTRRTGQPVSVILGELDRFAECGEPAGGGAGDEALRRVAAVIDECKRSWDTGARIAGEEFALLAPATDEHGAYILAERLRLGIAGAFEGGPAGPLTASFGIVSFPVHGHTPGALLQVGEQALRAAKQLGCNRSVISSAEVPGILARDSRAHDGAHVELATLLRLAEALDVRDSGTATHCQRVGRYAELIARELGLPPDSVERVRIAGILHDVGRVGVPDELLEREGPLGEEDWHWIRSHPEIGARMLETTDFADMGEWILAHHERPDGTGYPDGRGNGEVPIEARILGVADAYEAMTARRPYRQPLDPQAASDELRRGAGRQFDERVVRALLRVV